MQLIEQLSIQFHKLASKNAIVSSSRTMTYQELDKLTTRIANALRKQGIGAQDVVTIETSDKFEAICLLIGIVRAGAAYCVIPEDYPEQRKALMRTKVQAKWTVRSLSEVELFSSSVVDESIQRQEDSLLYIIFTSGSTGEPKAVAIEDQAIWKIVQHQAFYQGEVIGQFAPLEFDASIYELFGGLLNGLTLRLVSKDESLDFDIMPDLFKEIDMAFFTTRLFNLYVDECVESLSQLSLILTGGERCSIYHMHEAAKYCKVLNVYGPTETTVFATKYEVKGHETEMPIGQLFDQGVYVIFNEHKQPVTTGELGELWISDSGLMRGYMGDETATQKIFMTYQNRRFYRTGDIVFENPEGELVYVERKDRQVKISGYRIELGEIEKCAQLYGLQKDCVAHYDGNRLYLYVKDAVNLELFRQFLKNRLPDYMIPTVKVVDIIPMNANGKTDMKAIHELNEVANNQNHEVIDVVKEVLKSDIALDKTFLDLGGDSIRAMEIIWQLGNKGYQLDLNMLFSKTIGEIVGHVANS